MTLMGGIFIRDEQRRKQSKAENISKQRISSGENSMQNEEPLKERARQPVVRRRHGDSYGRFFITNRSECFEPLRKPQDCWAW